MGAAATTLTEPAQEELQGVGGQPSSTLAEMTALQLAANIIRSHPNQPTVTILTDSLTSISILEDRQRVDFQTTRLRDDEISVTSDKLIQTLNECARAGHSITIQKIKAHALEPLNERADELAEKAAELAPDDLPGEQLRCN